MMPAESKSYLTETSEKECCCDVDSLDYLDPPKGLEDQYHTIINLLSGCILERNNPVTFLMGPRGCGKHFVLETCLKSMMKKFSMDSSTGARHQPLFRIVHLSGLLLRGDDAAAAREIIRQLSSMSTTTTTTTSPVAVVPRQQAPASILSSSLSGSKKRLRDGSFSSAASFHSYITLLDEMLQRSRVDGIPIIIVISDVEAFASGKSTRVEKQALATAAVSGRIKQILLYHLLDMASSEKTYMGIFAITTRMNFFDMLEKRIRSRAFGAQAVIPFTKRRGGSSTSTSSTNTLFNIATTNVVSNSTVTSNTNTSSLPTLSTEYQNLIVILKQHLSRYYLQQVTGKDPVLESLQSILLNSKGPIYALFHRQLALGRTIRWFLRVLLVSYSFMMGPSRLTVQLQKDADHEPKVPLFTQQHLLDGLVAMGCDVTEAYKQGVQSDLLDGVASLKTDDNIAKHSLTLTRSSKAVLYKASNNHRMLPICDASTSQLVLLFSARRLLIKDVLSKSSSSFSTKVDQDYEMGVDYSRPLSFKRMYQEYHDRFVKVYSTYNATGRGTSKDGIGATYSSLIFPQHVLLQSFLQLLECDVFRPSADHSGGGILSYDFAKRYSPLALPDEGEVSSLPVHITIDIEEEFASTLNQSEELLDCIPVLKEWGMKCIT
jgi:hypothetical protein